MLFLSIAAKKGTVLKLISWKHSFKRLNEESEMAKKKKQALDSLLSGGRISQSTFEIFSEEISQALAEIERQQKALLEKMNSKMDELETQIKTLEILLANFEIQHVTGEVEEEVYQREISLLSAGLETSRHELEIVKEAIGQLSSGIQTPTDEAVAQQGMEQQPQPQENIDVSNAEVEITEEQASIVEENLPEPPVEPLQVSETDTSQTPQAESQEFFQSAEETQATETNVEGEEKQEA
ncbi:MAG: CdvA-like protein [Candidatus Bathyarchaeota archaeon]|nr:CdvA-like protein [Candidatus Bathyarchaeota archaeon]MDH5787154.1 CdvA-like protein [Candidatus Bathyarchaeota archaeon]